MPDPRQRVFLVPPDMPPQLLEILRNRFGAAPGDRVVLVPGKQSALVRDLPETRDLEEIIPHLEELDGDEDPPDPEAPPGARLPPPPPSGPPTLRVIRGDG